MKKLILALMFYTGFANAITLTIDGVDKEVDSVSVVITSNNVSVSTKGSVQPVPTPVPVPTPAPTSDCITSLMQKCGSISWANQGGRQSLYLTGSQVFSWKFTTTSNSSYAGDINIAEMTGFEPLSRRIWISYEPSGDVIPVSRCESFGNSVKKISWAQSESRFRCQLNTNTTYYLNVQHTQGCAEGKQCWFYRNTSTNGKP